MQDSHKEPWEDPNWDPIFDEEDPLASSISNAVSGKVTPGVDPIFDKDALHRLYQMQCLEKLDPIFDEEDEHDYDEDDGDALASAGFGTDEDYGGDMI